MKLLLKILLSITVIILIVFGGGMFFLARGTEAGAQLVIKSVDLSSMNDGVYYGKYKGGRWTNEVSVTVKNHKITRVNIIKDMLISKSNVSEELFDKVLLEQSTNVDVVSGATISSKAYLKSIENALTK